MTAELDNRRLVEESTGVKQQNNNARADEPAARTRYLSLRSLNNALLSRSVLHVQRSDPVVKERDAGTAVECDEQWDEQRTHQTQQYLQHINSAVLIFAILIITFDTCILFT